VGGLLAGLAVRAGLPGVSAAASRAGASDRLQLTDAARSAITVDYPAEGSIFPPDMVAPTFLWRDAAAGAKSWQVEVQFHDHGKPLRLTVAGELLRVGEIDRRCVSTANKLPTLTAEQAADHTWQPDAAAWAEIKDRSSDREAKVVFTGLDAEGHAVSQGQVTMITSKDPVGAPIFYRDVPLMPSEGANHVVQPLAPSLMTLINWRVRELSQPESRIVMTDQHTCANCHSFSADGKTMGMDVDGPGNDKGMYAVVPVAKTMSIGQKDIVHWNTDLQVGTSRVGFMSQVSPDGRYVLTTFAGPDQEIGNSYFVTNFKDYRFLQVFYPTRGILTWYSRATGLRKPLPGASDPQYVQTDGVWSPDQKYIVFARARSVDPHPAGMRIPKRANDPEETQIQYSLYRVPFNDGKGGVAEPIAGASENGMSNNFPKVSPDGKWIVFVKCRNGQLMRPDSELWIVPATGGVARKMRCNTSLMNSWHSFSPNGRWMVFSSKARSPYTQMYLTHIDEQGQDSPPILVENSTAANRAVNIPEFVNTSGSNIQKIETPAADFYRLMDEATDAQERGETATALKLWQQALGIDGEDARANNGMALTLKAAGRLEDSARYFRRATELNGRFVDAYYNLGEVQMEMHQLDEAINAWQTTVRIRPNYYMGHEGLGFAYYVKEDYAESLRHLRLALDGEPDRVSVLTLAASLMATCPDEALRDGPEAVNLAERARNLTGGKDVSVLDTLAAAYAEDQRFVDATLTEHQALAIASKEGDTGLVAKLHGHLALFDAATPLRVPPNAGTL
jgi:tetratricopeptide (TPR) repeat protein